MGGSTASCAVVTAANCISCIRTRL
jgi:hypothetical protein